MLFSSKTAAREYFQLLMVSRNLNLDEFPDSPYAAELRRGVTIHGFAPPLETEHLRTHLLRMRLRVRIWFSVVLLILLGLAFLFARTLGVDSVRFVVHVLVLIPGTAALAWLAWSDSYERHYVRAAHILMPIINVPPAAFVAQAVAMGDLLQVSGFVLNIIGVFFFAGLMYRSAIFTGGMMLAVFTATALAYQLPPPVLIVSLAVVALATFLSAVVYRDVELSNRKSFLESALIEELVGRDGLTGVMNRRAFDEHLLRIWQHALRDKRSLTVLMIDIDHFKHYNDTQGHQAGDVALRSVAQILKEFARRPLDLAARYGGEEFAIILYDLAPPAPQYMAEQMRMAVAKLGIPSPGTGTGAGVVTISVGVGTVQPTLGRAPTGALQLADEALYEAKDAGRNRISVKGDEEYRKLATGAFTLPNFKQ